MSGVEFKGQGPLETEAIAFCWGLGRLSPGRGYPVHRAAKSLP